MFMSMMEVGEVRMAMTHLGVLMQMSMTHRWWQAGVSVQVMRVIVAMFVEVTEGCVSVFVFVFFSRQ